MTEGKKQTRYIALLRGVNLGARNRVAMAELREVCETLGATEVKTYIASGNVLLTSAHPPTALRSMLEAAIQSEFHISIVVVVRTRRELAAAISANPFPDAAANALYVAFASQAISPEDIRRLDEFDVPPEEVAVVGRQIYLHLPIGYGRARLPVELDRRVKQPITVRNWRTVTTLNDMANTIST